MIDPKAEDIGRGVIYRSWADGPAEGGVITSITDRFVFVRYQNQPADADGKATKREQLEWAKS